ncbi:MAG: hypothetical protein IJF39_03725 [Clostridia bacterium]|nr:hypothetical protein [Clostridia bacterium]
MKQQVKRIISLALGGVLTTGLCTGLIACKPTEEAKAESLVSIDVNPSVSLVLDGENKVLSVIAENEDAQVLLYNENFVGLTAEQAAQKIADLAVELGYLNEGNRGVSITAQGKIDQASVEAAVKGAFESTLSAKGKDFEVEITTEGLFAMNRAVQSVNAQFDLDLSVAEYELILQAQAADKSLTVEAAAELSTEDLLAIVYEGVEDYVPYATEAYLAVKRDAFSVYYKAKEELLDSLWTAPYLNVLKYTSGNGLVYSTYTATSILLESGIWAAEQAAKIAEAITIPETVQNTIAQKLGFDEAQTAQFKQDIQDESGNATLTSLEEYLNTYFKNMTAEQRAEAQQAFDEVLLIAKNLAADVDAMVDREYKDAFAGLIEDMEEQIPEALKLVASNAMNQFKGTLERMQAATEGEEPLAGAYAALKELEKDKAQVLAAIQAELDDADRQAVETSIQNAESMFAGFELVMSEKLEQAEEAAKQFLAEAKAARESANAA